MCPVTVGVDRGRDLVQLRIRGGYVVAVAVLVEVPAVHALDGEMDLRVADVRADALACVPRVVVQVLAGLQERAHALVRHSVTADRQVHSCLLRGEWSLGCFVKPGRLSPGDRPRGPVSSISPAA